MQLCIRLAALALLLILVVATQRCDLFPSQPVEVVVEAATPTLQVIVVTPLLPPVTAGPAQPHKPVTIWSVPTMEPTEALPRETPPTATVEPTQTPEPEPTATPNVSNAVQKG